MNKVWPMVPLGEVIKERQEVPSAEVLSKGEIRIVAKIGFNDGQIKLRTGCETKTGMILIRPGDLVVSGINAAKGAIAIYGEENTEPITATIHYGAYIPKKERVNVKYLWWLLRSRTFRDLLYRYVPGGIKTELKAKRLLPIPVPLPSIEAQRRVIAKIEDLATKIQMAHNLSSDTMNNTKKWLDSCIQHVMNSFSNIGRFQDVIIFKPRSGPSFPTHPDWEGKTVLMPSSVTGFGVKILKVEHGMGNELISEKDLLRTGDIIIARGNKPEQVGNAGVVPDKAQGWVCANLLMRLQVDETKVSPHFCIYWLRSPFMRRYIKQRITGTNPSIQKINQQIILNLPFPTSIELDTQDTIVAHLDEMQKKVDTLTQLRIAAVRELDALLPSILDKAFKGEL